MNHVSTLQPLLGIDKSNPLFELLFNPELPNEVLVHFGTALLETVQRNSFQEKLLIARLYNSGFNRASLTGEFKYSRKTMQNWGEHLKSGKPENILKIADGQGGVKKITDDRRSFIEYLFNTYYEEKGCHINAFIVKRYKEVYRSNITVESIRLCLLEKRKKLDAERENLRKIKEAEIHRVNSISYPKTHFISENVIGAASENDSEFSIDRENTWRNSEVAGSNSQKKSKYSPSNEISPVKNFPIADKHPSKILSCYHVGVLISRIFIDQTSELDSDISDITRQWTAMILCNCFNIEQGQRLDYRALELFIGKQITSCRQAA